MPPIRTLEVFGEKIDVLVDGAMSNGAAFVMVQTTPPGGGPPPHSHSREDETFTVLEGDFELLKDGQWVKAPVGEILFAPRGNVHAFRNAGQTTGRIAVFIAPAGLETFFEKLSGLSPATDMPRILELFAEYGLSLHLPTS
ncbi:dimethylsulfonioproprionate lyase family protein [Edaphobacter aggregans]|uniref:dimethylsulfonioproprionate lyase family protein n=1 Tax=Edaphobacter aggregans TaxID=570835 RepID=UPI0012FC4CD1|nr:cupin domain-containing protein [Edaphobacter aggregans]